MKTTGSHRVGPRWPQLEQILPPYVSGERPPARLLFDLRRTSSSNRRISAWRNLVWDDVDFEAGTIRWRAEHDKKGFEQVVPMSSTVRDALLAQQKAQEAIGQRAVFPTPKDPMKPCSRHLLDDWLRRAYKLAKVVPQRRGMWHSIRRKWATERKGYPVKDVMEAGGWKNEETLLRS